MGQRWLDFGGGKGSPARLSGCDWSWRHRWVLFDVQWLWCALVCRPLEALHSCRYCLWLLTFPHMMLPHSCADYRLRRLSLQSHDSFRTPDRDVKYVQYKVITTNCQKVLFYQFSNKMTKYKTEIPVYGLLLVWYMYTNIWKLSVVCIYLWHKHVKNTGLSASKLAYR